MSVVVAVLVVVVVLLSVLVAGLLRSHGAILRRLDELGTGLEVDPGAPIGSRVVPRTDGSVPSPPSDVPDGRPAVDLAGHGPRGESVVVRVVEVPHDTLLVFLSTGCGTCAGFWDEIAATREQVPDHTRVVVVTRGSEEESPSAVAELAPTDVPVLMSSAAFEQLQVPGSPYVVQVDGPSGRVVGEGTAGSFAQVIALFLRSDGDARHAAGGKARADERRERHLDRILLEAGIGPGHPSLYGPDSEAGDAAGDGPTDGLGEGPDDSPADGGVSAPSDRGTDAEVGR